MSFVVDLLFCWVLQLGCEPGNPCAITYPLPLYADSLLMTRALWSLWLITLRRLISSLFGTQSFLACKWVVSSAPITCLWRCVSLPKGNGTLSVSMSGRSHHFCKWRASVHKIVRIVFYRFVFNTQNNYHFQRQSTLGIQNNVLAGNNWLFLTSYLFCWFVALCCKDCESKCLQAGSICARVWHFHQQPACKCGSPNSTTSSGL
jgi:hypothetical protein